MSFNAANLDLEYKPDFDVCMERVYAWYEGEIIDRIPVRFSAHNAEFEQIGKTDRWNTIKDRWFDTQYQVDHFISTLKEPFLGETFPVFWPNLGPNVFAAILGAGIEFGDVTSWSHSVVDSVYEIEKINFNQNSEYLNKLVELTDYALDRCEDKFIVGYTDIHPSLDCLDALRGTQGLLLDMYDDPKATHSLIEKCYEPFDNLMMLFFDKLKAKNQPSVNWMNIPSFEGVHVPSCDLGAMISLAQFDEFALSYIKREIKLFKHNIFHVDGVGVANHIDSILQIEQVNAIQWVQGVGKDRPIMQWVPFIKKIQAYGKGVVVDLQLCELEDFIAQVSPKGIYLCIDESDIDIQKSVLDRIMKW
ncbi:MAG: hypothetical protein HN389_12135 [Clostridia bacterium]|nr:hypothetical protein [Clostridia bacterium]